MVNVPTVCNEQVVDKQVRSKSDVEVVSRLSPLQQGIFISRFASG